MKELLIKAFGLQIFADGGTNTNVLHATSTGGYQVNSYTGTAAAKDAANVLAPELKDFYDTEMLENARTQMVYAQFAKRQHLPAGHGGNIEFRKWNTFGPAEELQEGVIPTGRNFGATAITASIKQHGAFTTISDVLELRAFDDVILGATEEMGASAAMTQEYLIRDGLLANGNIMYCDNIKDDGTFVSTPTSCATMHTGSTNGAALLTPTMVNKAVTKMKKDKVPTINGKYVAVIHPSVAFDLRQSPEWIEVHKYMGATEIFNGEIGELHGVRFIEDVDAPIMNKTGYANGEKGSGNNGCTYITYFFGKDAFAIIDPEGGALEMIIKDKTQAGGPLDQFSTIGYKFETNGATVLYPERVLALRSVSAYSATDEPNAN